MGKMYTLKPDESINDHVKDSIATLNHIVELSISCMRDLANPHEGTFVDMTYNDFMDVIEHVRNSIEMLDELCDELEDDKDEIRQEYEEKVIQFFNRFLNSDLADEHNYREGELARLVHQLDNRCSELDKELEQTQKHCSKLVRDRDKAVEDWTKHCEALHQTYREKLAAKDREIYKLIKQGLSSTYGKVNSPCNFCGNCRHYAQMGKDDGDFEGICTRHYITRVDPDDASCEHFKPTYDTRVVIGKPEFPCCEHCTRDDCDDCTLCPF